MLRRLLLPVQYHKSVAQRPWWTSPPALFTYSGGTMECKLPVCCASQEGDWARPSQQPVCNESSRVLANVSNISPSPAPLRGVRARSCSELRHDGAGVTTSSISRAPFHAPATLQAARPSFACSSSPCSLSSGQCSSAQHRTLIVPRSIPYTSAYLSVPHTEATLTACLPLLPSSCACSGPLP